MGNSLPSRLNLYLGVRWVSTGDEQYCVLCSFADLTDERCDRIDIVVTHRNLAKQ